MCPQEIIVTLIYMLHQGESRELTLESLLCSSQCRSYTRHVPM